MIFIAFNYEGRVTSIVDARNEELAHAYWQGANIDVHSSKCLERDYTPLDEHPTGVFPILKTETCTGYDLFPMGRVDERKFLLVKK